MSNEHQNDRLAALADHLGEQRDAILSGWKAEAEKDREQSMLAELSRSEFYDHIPQFLDRLHAAFCGENGSDVAEAAREHGAHRWQQGRPVAQVVREWGLLHRILMQRIAASWEPVELNPESYRRAFEVLSESIEDAIAASLGEYHAHLQVQADARVRDLEAVLDEREEMDQARSENLHQASHDLRGSLQAIRLASHILTRRPLDEQTRAIVERIRDAAESLYRMLNDLLDLARLEAGRETREISGFNAAALLHELCDGLQSTADSKGLSLKAHGPATLRVRGDPMKVQRIAQNLVLNALKYTSQGDVEVEWKRDSPERWQFLVRDTGPGLKASSGGAYAASLEAAGDEGKTAPPSRKAGGRSPAQSPSAAPDVAAHGEGVGLAIVHRLCNLLDAVLDVDSEPGHGTTFTVLLPTKYESA
ncbi:MAG TPA: sensor histidine kinase [Gammaproteobacteria bacterium]|nr:sensor histidine kinase [Gammaproteobacteria bacterium]